MYCNGNELPRIVRLACQQFIDIAAPRREAFGWNKAMNSRRIHLNTEAHSQSAIPLPSLQCCCLPLRKNERFQQVGPGLFIRCYYSQDIADGKHAQKLLFLAEHDKVVDTVLFH